MAAVSSALGAGGGDGSVQNGVGNEEAIAEHVERVIRGTTFLRAHCRAGTRPVGT